MATRDLYSSSDDEFIHEMEELEVCRIVNDYPYDSDEDDDDDDESSIIMCDPDEHSWITGECRICTFCNCCTGYGIKCCNEGEPDREPGDQCGCGHGDAGCLYCGVCKVCADESDVPPSWAEDNMMSAEDDGNDTVPEDLYDGEDDDDVIDSTGGQDLNPDQEDDPNPDHQPKQKKRRAIRSSMTVDEDNKGKDHTDDDRPSSGSGDEEVSMEVAVRRKQISGRMEQEKFKRARGIIFIVGVGGADGTDVDVDNVEDTFKGLNFATFPVHDPTASEISTLIKAAADPEIYPYRYNYVAFYFAGHGGKDQKDMFIIGLQKEDNQKEILYVNDHIINPLKCLHKKKLSRLFFFDCCQSPGEGTAYRSAESALKKKPKPYPGELVAYATSEGEKSFGDRKKGGIWTHHLCKNIREMNEPILTILTVTFDDVVKARDSFQQPYLTAAIGTLRLKDTNTKHASRRRSTIPSVSGTTGRKKPAILVKSVYNGLKSHSSLWSDFALELEVDDDFRDSLEANDSLSDDQRLESVLTHWTEKKTCEVSLDKIVAIAKELQLPSATIDTLNNANKLPWRKIFQCFKQKASEWNSIAGKLLISSSFCDDLKQKTSFTDCRKLEKVIRQWIDNKTCDVTWDKIISVASELDMDQVAKQLESASKQ